MHFCEAMHVKQSHKHVEECTGIDQHVLPCSDFVARAKRLLEQGGAKVTELETLIAQAEQFAWGPADVTADINDLHSRLKDAKQWVAQVRSYTCQCA